MPAQFAGLGARFPRTVSGQCADSEQYTTGTKWFTVLRVGGQLSNVVPLSVQ
jgi:hypothetical protein